MVKMKKTDLSLLKDAERDGLLVSIDSGIKRTRNHSKNNEVLHRYFREKLPHYCSWNIGGEEEGEDILEGINEHLQKHKINKHPLSFPLSSGYDVHLIPINKNIQLKVLVVDEYFGGGDYSKYVQINEFIINKNTTRNDVDDLINFINEYFLGYALS